MSQKESNCYYVTTPIYYVNARPHIGHTYTTTVADALTRFYKMLGKDTFFLTGTDEHGDKLMQAAQAAGKTPLEFVTEISDDFRATWKELGFEYSRFIRTTDEDHKKVVQHILDKLYKKGDIYFGEYGGNYCYGCERFLTEKELVDGKCPDHQKPTTYISEKNYFFKMSKYQEQLIAHINEHPDFIRPERYKNEVLAMLREPLEDLCISRPKSRLTWGIELPFDTEYVTYVWFDALVNYLSGVDYPNGENYKKYWGSCEHLIAKDIVKPHAVYWPTMLLAADIPLYQHLNVHGYWVFQDSKMSKSLGNVVDPKAIKQKYGMDVFRYFIFREMSFGLDGNFTWEALDGRYHADLANNLGNLVSRSLAMVEKYRDGIVPQQGALEDLDTALKTQAEGTASEIAAFIDRMEIHRALERIWTLIDAANVYIDRTKPWAVAKEEKTNPAQKARLDTILYFQLETIRIIAGLISPFMPETAEKIFGLLGFDQAAAKKQLSYAAMSTWGDLPAGAKVTKGEALFPRKDVVEEKKQVEQPVEQPTQENLITYDEFSKVELCVGQILEAEKIAKSDKLLKLQVDLGARGKRQIIAGIGKQYTAEELPGRKVIVVANLKPAKLMGQESRGMLLAAADESGTLSLVSCDPLMPAGAEVR